MPASATFRSWASRVPSGFTFAVKASRYLTHVRRLQDPRDAVSFLMDRAGELGPHLGPILLQLPPDMTIDLDRLADTLDAFPSSTRVAVEPRHPSWYTDACRAVLTEHGAALCLADRRGPLGRLRTGRTFASMGVAPARHRATGMPRSRHGPTSSERRGASAPTAMPTSTTTITAVPCATPRRSAACCAIGSPSAGCRRSAMRCSACRRSRPSLGGRPDTAGRRLTAWLVEMGESRTPRPEPFAGTHYERVR
jgi:hypothetical protein